MFTNPPPPAIRALLKGAKTIAVVGISPRPERPAISEVLGLTAYARLPDVPERIDLVDVFRNPEDSGPGMTVVMDRCISVEYRKLLA